MLITSATLATYMRHTLDEASADLAITIAEGWLLDATRLDPWPDAESALPDLVAWCIELSALTYTNNPRQVISRTTGGVATMWAADAQARRQSILDAARARYNASSGPVGNFPCAEPWPDPAVPRWGGHW